MADQQQHPSQRIKATVFLHPVPPEGPLKLELTDPVLALLTRLSDLQRLQAGEDIIPPGDGLGKPIDKLAAGEHEVCLTAGAAELLRCSPGKREVFRVLSWQEDEALMRARDEAREETQVVRSVRETVEYQQHVSATAAKLGEIIR